MLYPDADPTQLAVSRHRQASDRVAKEQLSHIEFLSRQKQKNKKNHKLVFFFSSGLFQYSMKQYS